MDVSCLMNEHNVISSSSSSFIKMLHAALIEMAK